MRVPRQPVRLRLRHILVAGAVAACGGEPVATTETPTQTPPASTTAEAASTSTAEATPTATASPSESPTAMSSTATASPAPVLPPIPKGAFEAADPGGFTKAAEEALAALLDHAAKSCPKKSPAEPGKLDASPAGGTVWDKEPRILEVAVICNVAAGGGSHAIETFAPLRKSVRDEQHKSVTTMEAFSGGAERNRVCPSAFSDEAGALDIGLHKALGGGSTVDVFITVALPKHKCMTDKNQRAEKERRAHVAKVVEPFRAGITETMKKLEETCATAASSKPKASPAAETALAKDKRVLEVESTCYLGRGNGAPVVTLPFLTGKKPGASLAAQSFHGAARSGKTLETVNHLTAKGQSNLPVSITFEKQTAKGRIVLEVSVDAASVPAPPKT